MTDTNGTETKRLRPHGATLASPVTAAVAFDTAWLIAALFLPSLHATATVQQYLMLLTLCVLGVMLLALGLAHARLSNVVRTTAFSLVAAILMVAGTLVLAFLVNEDDRFLWGSIAAVLLALGQAMTTIGIAHVVVTSDTASTSRRIIVGVSAGGIIAAACALASAPVAGILCAFLGLAASGCLVSIHLREAKHPASMLSPQPSEARTSLYKATQSGITRGAGSDVKPPRDAERQGALLQKLSFLLKLCAALGLFGVVVGIVQFYLTFSIASNGGITLMLTVAAGTLICTIAAWLSLRLSEKSCYSLLYRIVTVAAVLCCMLILFISQTAEVRLVLFYLCLSCLVVIAWGLLAEITIRHSVQRMHAFGCGLGCLSLGIGCGLAVSIGCGFDPDYLFQNLYTLLIVAATIVIITFAFVFTDKDIEHFFEPRTELADLKPEGEKHTKSIEERSADLAAAHGLSARETEVLVLLAKGRSGTRIEQELYISRGTVNSHMRNIYQKLDVHSRQELLDLFENETASDGA